ncbi:MAG: hypothetical protein AB7S38_05155 [Vulcanimicrobiota bacterium]
MRIHNLFFASILVVVAAAARWWTLAELPPEPARGVLLTEMHGRDLLVRLTNVGGEALSVTTCGYGDPCAADISVDFHRPTGEWIQVAGPRCGTGLRIGQLVVGPGQSVERIYRGWSEQLPVATVTILARGEEAPLSSGPIAIRVKERAIPVHPADDPNNTSVVSQHR